MPAYQLLCLNDRGVMIHMVAAECQNDREAVHRAIELLADDCTTLEITSMFCERTVWQGTREEAKTFVEGAAKDWRETPPAWPAGLA
ncbi:MAG TPA: hypothetical protein VHW69_12705 [Rhizomicrobium sp.]|jgi:hypothetical protein|nr:hypothetical protein [Rhizomicrobium sp.]